MTRHAPKSNTRRPPASTPIPIAEAARQLGVTREHLSRVLHGHRISKRLSARFAKLQAETSVVSAAPATRVTRDTREGSVATAGTR